MKPFAPHRRRRRASLATVFAVPTLLLVATIAGLVIGLNGDGLPDFLAWALLALPLLALAHAWAKRS
ncbi:hypothetical protein GCM10023208_08970 [Erythrobacter westpacificensis]|uniref:DUF4175 domain-containing protein n=1 Tax=Erythrobacter westpacificensis TaxID=1055231 RepID=A0ABP9K2Z7_9SPHN|tara:strand:- start:112 stop:312 length:201 start_codon:yes stop_codon:yes gene_type:complete